MYQNLSRDCMQVLFMEGVASVLQLLSIFDTSIVYRHCTCIMKHQHLYILLFHCFLYCRMIYFLMYQAI